jgi:hypothetical protein
VGPLQYGMGVGRWIAVDIGLKAIRGLSLSLVASHSKTLIADLPSSQHSILRTSYFILPLSNRKPSKPIYLFLLPLIPSQDPLSIRNVTRAICGR